jgi:hypothetical protein
MNLRWALPEVQMNNRERNIPTVRLCSTGEVFNKVTELSSVVGANAVASRHHLRAMDVGSVCVLPGTNETVEILERSTKKLKLCLSAASCGSRKKAPGKRVQEIAFKRFMEGDTAQMIASTWHKGSIMKKTIVNYIGKQAAEIQKDELQRFAERVLLSDPNKRKTLFEIVVKAKSTEDQDFEPVRMFVQEHCSGVAEDWELFGRIAGPLFEMLR